ncbi:MAG TPA: hypothetical protein VKK79_05050 [Candidatus Lokiarchaeia archaeon]|nr:hypothetical protein [Candidatus Lokiarchaeia archaeon]
MPHVLKSDTSSALWGKTSAPKRNEYQVAVSERAYRRIVGYSYRYANESLKSLNWREVYGILVGHVDQADGGKVYVEDAVPMVVGERAGVTFEAKQYVDLASIDASVYEKTTKGGRMDFIVGWFHTHPGFGFFFSEVDKMTHLGYQMSNPSAVGLIFDHTQLSSFDCGLECLKLVNPEALYAADHTFLVFALENCDAIVPSIPQWVEKLREKLKLSARDIGVIDIQLRKRQFAQLQRNFGLLLVPKRLTKDEKQEALGEDEDMWVWDEKYLETMYRIPVFRKRVERMLKMAAKNKKRKNAIADAQKIQAILQRPQELFNGIIKRFWRLLNSVANTYFYLDTNERQVVEMFDQRLREYGRILNDLWTRATQIIDGSEIGKRVPNSEEAGTPMENLIEILTPGMKSLPHPVLIPTPTLIRVPENPNDGSVEEPADTDALEQLALKRKVLIKKTLEKQAPVDEAEDGKALIEKALGEFAPETSLIDLENVKEMPAESESAEQVPQAETLDEVATVLNDAHKEVPEEESPEDEGPALVQIEQGMSEEGVEAENSIEGESPANWDEAVEPPKPLFEKHMNEEKLKDLWKRRASRKVKSHELKS